ncbi:MAG TPA: endo alpha-1,4 polygalactosaminidase [Nitrosomonas sp.]|nr:endo alpha-1,4 polygalactosaminidase [Nitrosomonas sp.]
MQTNIKILLVILFLFSFGIASAQVIEPPAVEVTKNRTAVSITWPPVLNATGYRLLYAPYPYTGADSVQSVDMGGQTALSVELWDGAAFYVAVTAYDDSASSNLSNIELFYLSAAPVLDPDALPVTGINWYKPPVSISWQWQLNGEVNPDYPVDLYDIDLFDSPVSLINALKASGKKVICYFSAGSYENFREDKDKFDPAVLGNTLDGWPDEQWLDIRALNVADIMAERLDLAMQKGCDGVEPDNMTAYLNNSGFDLSAGDQLAFNKFIANEAHKRSLSVGLKNDLDQIPELVDFYDFSVNEQCHEFDECDTLAPFIQAGKPVLNAEYLQKFSDDADERRTLCNMANNAQFSTLVLPLNLDDSFRLSCF